MGLTLAELDPQFIRHDQRSDGVYLVHVDNIAEAQGIMFLCPQCFQTNKGPVGTHSCICWSRSAGTPEDVKPLPGRWRMVGSGYGDLSLVGDVKPDGKSHGSNSVLIEGGCRAHFFVESGRIRLL